MGRRTVPTPGSTTDDVHGFLRKIAIRLRDQERRLDDFVSAHLVS